MLRLMAVVVLMVGCGGAGPADDGFGGGAGGGGGTKASTAPVYSENLYLCSVTIRCTGIEPQYYSVGPYCAKGPTEASQVAKEQATCGKPGRCPCSFGSCSKYQNGC